MPREHAKHWQKQVVYLSEQAARPSKELCSLAGHSSYVLLGRDPTKHLGLNTLD